jgi:membrane-associated protease RseP (regulator of RpoE activity)
MRNFLQNNYWARLLFLLLLTLPMVLMFLLPVGAVAPAVWFWIFGFLTILLLWAMAGRPRDDDESWTPRQPVTLGPAEQPEPVRNVMDVDEAMGLPQGVALFRGRLREPAEQAFDDLRRTLPQTVIPLMQPDPQGRTSLVLLPRDVERAKLERKVRPWVHWLLFGLTLITTTFAGAAHQGVNLLREPERFMSGLPYSLALLAILGCHELGHYFTARHHRMNVTPPYFIPVPFALGTFGAFIQMRSPAENRRTLFDVAVAGPLAGLVVAIPALYFGLQDSEIVRAGSAPVLEGLRGVTSQASILMAFLVHWSLGEAITSGDTVRLTPMAFAGWLGLLVTALNLLPIGQLDGGHIARAMFGTRTGMMISWLSMLILFALAIFVWPGLMFWAIIVFFIAGRGTPPLNDITPLTGGRKLLGVFAFFILAIILAPMPSGCSPGDLRCPYI